MLKTKNLEIVSREVALSGKRRMLFLAVHTNGQFVEYKVLTGRETRIRGKRRVVDTKILIHIDQVGAAVMRVPSPEELQAIAQHDEFVGVL